MIETRTDVATIRPIAGDEAAELAAVEYARMLDVLHGLGPGDWGRRTPCAAWDVRALVGHVVGSVENYASLRRSVVDQTRAALRARRTGERQVDAWTAVHVADHADTTPDELVTRFDAVRQPAVRQRMRLPRPLRAARISDSVGTALTLGDLMRIVATRDSWMHRDDLARATGKPMHLTPEHDGHLVADVVAEWARRHGRPFGLTLTGPAGGAFRAGTGAPELELDAVEFCRILSGRGVGEGLLAHGVAF